MCSFYCVQTITNYREICAQVNPYVYYTAQQSCLASCHKGIICLRFAYHGSIVVPTNPYIDILCHYSEAFYSTTRRSNAEASAKHAIRVGKDPRLGPPCCRPERSSRVIHVARNPPNVCLGGALSKLQTYRTSTLPLQRSDPLPAQLAWRRQQRLSPWACAWAVLFVFSALTMMAAPVL